MYLVPIGTSSLYFFFFSPFVSSALLSLLVICPAPFLTVVLRVQAMAGETVLTDGVPACL